VPDTDRGQGQAAVSEARRRRARRGWSRAEAAGRPGRLRQSRRRGFSWLTPVAVLLIVAGWVLAVCTAANAAPEQDNLRSSPSALPICLTLAMTRIIEHLGPMLRDGAIHHRREHGRSRSGWEM